jgi:tyrosine-protein phosphatase SIW14
MPAQLRLSLLPVLFALSLSTAGLQAASIAEAPGVPNFHQVDEHVYRGAQPTEQGFASLAKIGIRTVIDLRGERSEESKAQRAGMRYVRLPWSGFKAPDETQIEAVLLLLNDSTQWPVFVHCKHGVDRTGTAIACYRIAHDHWSNEQALAEAKEIGMNPLQRAMRSYILHFTGAMPETASSAR